MALYTPPPNRLVGLLLGWDVVTLTLTIGIRGSYDLNRLNTNLSSFGLTATQTDWLMRVLISHTLTELAEMYNARYAAPYNG